MKKTLHQWLVCFLFPFLFPISISSFRFQFPFHIRFLLFHMPVCLAPKNLQAGYLWWRVMQFTDTWAIWLLQQHADALIWLHPSLTSERVQTLFFDKAAGCVRKIWCLGKRLQESGQIIVNSPFMGRMLCRTLSPPSMWGINVSVHIPSHAAETMQNMKLRSYYWSGVSQLSVDQFVHAFEDLWPWSTSLSICMYIMNTNGKSPTLPISWGTNSLAIPYNSSSILTPGG